MCANMYIPQKKEAHIERRAKQKNRGGYLNVGNVWCSIEYLTYNTKCLSYNLAYFII